MYLSYNKRLEYLIFNRIKRMHECRGRRGGGGGGGGGGEGGGGVYGPGGI